MRLKLQQRALWSDRVMDALAAEQGAVLTEWVKAYGDELMKRKADLLNCPKEFFFDESPSIWVDSENQCELTMSVGTADPFTISSLEDALKESNSCEEFVKAKFGDAQMDQAACLNGPSEPVTRNQDFLLTDQFMEKQIQELEGHLTQYRSACTKTAEAEIAKRVAEMNLDALNKAPPGKAPPKKKNKRATRKSRGR